MEKTKQGSRKIILFFIVGCSALFSFLFGFLSHLFEKAHSPGVVFKSVTENYFFSSLILATILVGAFSLGFLAWICFKRKRSKIFYFTIFNVAGLILFVGIDAIQYYRIWHYDKYQANIDYNEFLAQKNGGYLDTCMVMVQSQIIRRGLSMNDFRVLSYEYENAFATLPRDTTNRYYLFSILYSTNDTKIRVRAASYLINFNGRIKEIYDVDAKDQKAAGQIKSLKENIKDLKDILEKNPNSFDKNIEEIKSKI